MPHTAPNPDAPIILHAHIFKNAGTTFDWILQRYFGEGFTAHVDDASMKQGGAQYLAEFLHQRPQIRALSSHCMPVSILERGLSHVLLAGFLRHPMLRARSVYRFEAQQQVQTPGAIAAKEKNFAEYIGWRLQQDVRPVLRDFQTRYLLEQGESKTFELGSDAVQQAAARLAGFQLVGIVERFDESMLVFEDVLATLYPDLGMEYVQQNRSSANAGSNGDSCAQGVGENSIDTASMTKQLAAIENSLGSQLYADLVGANSHDMALYQHACAELDQTLADIGALSQKMLAFARRKAALQIQ